MKKIFALLLALTMTVSLCACGGKDEEKLHLWETASTDVIDFSIDEADFAIYASPLSDSYLAPTEEKSSFAAPTGKTIVSISFTIKNKDRAATVNIGSSNDGDIYFPLDWKIKYNGNEYEISSLRGGKFGMEPGAILNRYTQVATEKIGTSNHLLFDGLTESYRIAGIVDFEPTSLDEVFEIEVSLPDSKGDRTKLTYISEYGENSNEIFYNIGLDLLKEGSYSYAIKQLELAGDYSDAKEKLEEAKFMYYSQNPTTEDASTYFKNNKDKYELLKANDIISIIVGDWKTSSNYGKTISFLASGVIDNQYISNGTWKISGDCLEYKENDKSPAQICEVRKLKENMYLLYENGTTPIVCLWK